MSRGPRVCLEPNIYQDRSGLAAKVQVGVVYRERRWPADAPLSEIRRWIDRTRSDLHDEQPETARGTLAHDAARYYRQITHLRSWRERRAEIRRWCERYGAWPRGRIKRAQVLETRATWLKAGVQPKTINNRVDALRQLWRGLDGVHLPTPCDDVAPLEVPAQPIQIVDPATIRKVYQGLLDGEASGRIRDAKTRARFMVLASSGVRASELARVEPGDVDVARRVWLTRDGKGGRRPGGLYLHDDLLRAWEVFIAAEAWGSFETSAFARTLRTAGWPPDVRPYQLRHSVGIALSEAGHDLADVGAWLGHSRIETTRAHYVPVLAGRMRAVGETIGGRIGWPDPEPRGTARGTAE